MPETRILVIPTMKGFAEVWAHADQPPGTSDEVRNVSFTDPITGRIRLSRRAGTGLADLYDFISGQTISAHVVTIPGTGGNPGNSTDSNYYQTNPTSSQCYAVTLGTGNPGVDYIISGATVSCASIFGTNPYDIAAVCVCGPSSIVYGGQPNPGTSSNTDGTIHITYPPGGPSDPPPFPVNQGPGSSPPPPPPTDPDRPYLSVRVCNSTVSKFWVYESVLAIYDALPVLKDNNTASATYGQCLTVTGQRTDTPSSVRPVSEFTVMQTCTECLSNQSWCFYQFQVTYSCDTGSWGVANSAFGSICDQLTSYPNHDQWVFDGDISTSIRTFNYFKAGNATCSGLAPCASFPVEPSVPTGAPEDVDEDATCSPPDTLVIRLYRLSTGVKLMEVTVTNGGSLLIGCQDGAPSPSLVYQNFEAGSDIVGQYSYAYLFSASVCAAEIYISTSAGTAYARLYRVVPVGFDRSTSVLLGVYAFVGGYGSFYDGIDSSTDCYAVVSLE